MRNRLTDFPVDAELRKFENGFGCACGGNHGEEHANPSRLRKWLENMSHHLNLNWLFIWIEMMFTTFIGHKITPEKLANIYRYVCSYGMALIGLAGLVILHSIGEARTASSSLFTELLHFLTDSAGLILFLIIFICFTMSRKKHWWCLLKLSAVINALLFLGVNCWSIYESLVKMDKNVGIVHTEVAKFALLASLLLFVTYIVFYQSIKLGTSKYHQDQLIHLENDLAMHLVIAGTHLIFSLLNLNTTLPIDHFLGGVISLYYMKRALSIVRSRSIEFAHFIYDDWKNSDSYPSEKSD